MKNTCTTESNRKIALKNVERKHIENGYPENYVKSVIREVKERNFQPKDKKIDDKKTKKEFPDLFHCFSYNNIDYGCEKQPETFKKL